MSNTILVAMIGLTGVFLGGIISAAATYVSTRRQAAFRVREKIVDKQLAAYEKILAIIKEMRTTTIPENMSVADGLAFREPHVLVDNNAFWEWQGRVLSSIGEQMHWLDKDVRKMLMILQNYLNSISDILPTLEEGERNSAMVAIRNDFVRVANELEISSTTFLAKTAHRFAFRPTLPDEKLLPDENETWLRSTELFKFRNGQNKLNASNGKVG